MRHIYYFLCDTLDCGFKCRDRKPGLGVRQPPLKSSVLVVALNRNVSLEYVGHDEEGRKVLLEHSHADHIFPVKFFHTLRRIDPKLSKNFQSNGHELWLRLIAAYKGEEFISNRQEYCLVKENKVLQTRFMTEDELVKALKFEEKHYNRISSKYPGLPKAKWELSPLLTTS